MFIVKLAQLERVSPRHAGRGFPGLSTMAPLPLQRYLVPPPPEEAPYSSARRHANPVPTVDHVRWPLRNPVPRPGSPRLSGAPPSATRVALRVLDVVVVLIVVAAVIWAVFYNSFGGGLGGPGSVPNSTAEMVVHAGNWSGANLSFAVASVTGAAVNIAGLVFLVESQGTAYYYGTQNEPRGTGAFVVNVVFHDTDNDGRASAGDAITLNLAGSGNPLHGGSLKVLQGTSMIGSATIP